MTVALELEARIDGKAILEKNDISQEGVFQSYARTTFKGLEQYSKLVDDFIQFSELFPNMRGTAEYAVQELAMNAYKYNGGQGTIEFIEHEHCLYVLVTGEAHDPRVGCRTPEDRGFDPNNKKNGWEKNGRKVEHADGTADYCGWGKMFSFMNSDLFGYTEDGRIMILGFNKK